MSGPEAAAPDPSDDIFDGLPHVRTSEGDTNWYSRSSFIVEPKAPFIEFTYTGKYKAPSPVEKERIRVMKFLHTASKAMELGSNDEAAAADILFRVMSSRDRTNNEKLRLMVLASVISAMWQRGIAVKSDSVYRTYEELGGTLSGESDRKKLDSKLNTLILRLFAEAGVRSIRNGLKESAAQALAGELGLDDSSSAVLVALTRAINDKSAVAASVAASIISYLIGRSDTANIWGVLWPPRARRVRIDGLTVVLGDGDHVDAEVEDNVAKVVCSHCGAVIYSNKNAKVGPKSFPYNKEYVLRNLLSKAPHVCPVCGAKLSDDRRVFIRAIGLKYHILVSSSKGTRSVKKEAKVVLPKGAALTH
ncbi:MAG: hypothetical protein RXO54_05295 [Acidilobus sp.]|jgi:hypothetical protein